MPLLNDPLAMATGGTFSLVQGGSGGSGFTVEVINRLQRIEDQLTADILKGSDRLQHLRKGTDEVILDKDVTFSRETGFTILEHQEPDP